MTIDIHDYVDRYLNDYIFYHGQHFAEDVGDIVDEDMANYVFGGQYQEELESAALGQQAQARMFNSGDKRSAAASIDIADQIANGTILQEILDQIALEVNQAIYEKATQIEYDKLYASALSYAGMMANGTPKDQSVRAFLQLLTYALNQGGGYNARFLAELNWFGRTVTGKTKRFKFTPAGQATVVSQDQLVILTKIQDSLVRAAEKFRQLGGELSANSFRSTIVYIFSRLIKNNLAQNMVAAAMQSGDKQVEDILVSLGFKPQQASPTGEKINYKTYVIDSDELSLSVAQHDLTGTIEIGTNMQLNLVDSSGASNDFIMLANSTIGEFFIPGTPSRYYAYNIMAHKHQYPDQYNILRGSIAANFLKNAALGNRQQVNQFLMFEGKVYPVFNIIKNICDECMRNGIQNVPGIVIQELGRGSNSWQTASGIMGPNLELALVRSKLVNNIIDKLTISLNYNINMLSQYIK